MTRDKNAVMKAIASAETFDDLLNISNDLAYRYLDLGELTSRQMREWLIKRKIAPGKNRMELRKQILIASL